MPPGFASGADQQSQAKPFTLAALTTSRAAALIEDFSTAFSRDTWDSVNAVGGVTGTVQGWGGGSGAVAGQRAGYADASAIVSPFPSYSWTDVGNMAGTSGFAHLYRRQLGNLRGHCEPGG